MKKLLILLLVVMSFSSCESKPDTEQNVPTEVRKLISSNNADTSYTVLTSDKKLYVFNNKKEYVGTYKSVSSIDGVDILVFIVCIVIFILLLLL